MTDRQMETDAETDARLGISLSQRELEVLDLLSHGYSYADAAGALRISVDTVKSHSKHIFVKLGAENGPHAVGLGFRTGLLQAGDVA